MNKVVVVEADAAVLYLVSDNAENSPMDGSTVGGGGSSRCSSSSRKRVVSDLHAGTSSDSKIGSSTNRNSNHSSPTERPSLLHKIIRNEQNSHSSLKDHVALLQTDPAVFQNTVWRERVAQWYYDVLDFQQEPRELTFLAMNILDRYLAAMAVERCATTGCNAMLAMDHLEYEVLSITSLFLAVRIAGVNKHLTIPEVLELSTSGVQVRHVLSAGNSMLEKVSWDHPITTPHMFLKELCNHLMQCAPCLLASASSCSSSTSSSSSSTTTASSSSLFEFASYLVEVSVCDTYFTQVLPSEIALGALALSMTCDEDVATRQQASFALFLQSVQTETNLDIDSPRMKAVLSRLLYVYNQSQEAAIVGDDADAYANQSHYIQDVDGIYRDERRSIPFARSKPTAPHVILEDQEDTGGCRSEDSTTRNQHNIPPAITHDGSSSSSMSCTTAKNASPLFIAPPLMDEGVCVDTAIDGTTCRKRAWVGQS